MSVRSEALMRGVDRLKAEGSASARVDARILLAHAMGITPGEILTTSHPPTDEQLAFYDALLARRAACEPIAYITGRKEFWSLDFEVGPGVLIPRPDTETLVMQALNEFPDKAAPLNVLDLGTGSGAILIAFLHERPNARGLGIEQSQEAMMWAHKNIARHHLQGRATLQGDDWLLLNEGAFDVIFSNPPYIESGQVERLEPDVARHEPRAALDGGPEGLDAYRALAPLLAKRLKPGGKAFLEIGLGQEGKVPSILNAAGLETLRVAPDLAGIPRCVVAAHDGKKALETRG
ncbi:MAG TPA: peptide chain release factor N(5)-glutamine methyltransferase [Rhizomicrobium sp.]